MSEYDGKRIVLESMGARLVSGNQGNSQYSSDNFGASVKQAGSQSGSQNPNWTPYTITSRGINSQGNKYDNRDEPSGKGFHYSNQDGSYFYHHGDNSTYHNDGKGNSTYTAPNGRVYTKSGLPETRVKKEAKTEVKREEVPVKKEDSYQAGFKDGYGSGYNIGHSNGYDHGYEDGYEDGY